MRTVERENDKARRKREGEESKFTKQTGIETRRKVECTRLQLEL